MDALLADTLTACENPSLAPGYFAAIAERRSPVTVIEQGSVLEALRGNGGAHAFSVPDAQRSDQIQLPLYIGFTIPGNGREIPHWHTDQAEVYVIVHGEAEIVAQPYRDGDQWFTYRGGPGSLFLIAPQVCHWLRWRTDEGLAYVFKAPQRAGLGPFPAGRTDCQHGCPMFGRGCTPPHVVRKPQSDQ